MTRSANSQQPPRRGDLNCPVCASTLFLHNSRCLTCSSAVGYRLDLAAMALVHPSDPHPGASADAPTGFRCANAWLAGCTWLVPTGDPAAMTGAVLCASCRLTEVRPHDADLADDTAFRRAEEAKRRLIDQMRAIGLPLVGRRDDPQHGVGFAFLLSSTEPIVTGYADGLITVDLAEADDVHRERVRRELGEPYRTVLGHLRHELAHHVWPQLIGSSPTRLNEFRELFGDERADYETARADWYAGRRSAVGDDRVSAYAHMHPHEDWAETFAHYLLIDDALAIAARLGVAGGTATGLADAPDVNSRIDDWADTSTALNEVARATGQRDLYPFVVTDGVRRRLMFAHNAIASVTSQRL